MEISRIDVKQHTDNIYTSRLKNNFTGNTGDY